MRVGIPLPAVAALALGLAATSGRARAQGFDAQTYTPPAGRSAVIAIADPDPGSAGTVVLGTGASYARWPLVRSARCDLDQSLPDVSCLRDDGRTPIVSDLVQLELALAATLGPGLQLGLVAPIEQARVADSVLRPERLDDTIGPGDLRVSAGLPLLGGGTALMIGVAASLPSGDDEVFLGAGSASIVPHVIVRQRIGHAALAAQLGYRARERRELLGLHVDDELDAMLGVSVPVLSSFDLRAELRGRFGVFAGGSRGSDPIEGTLAAAIAPSPSLALLFGAGAGVWPGRDGYGAPLLRVIASLRYAFQVLRCGGAGQAPCAGAGEDSDDDGLDDAHDGCPDQAEDEDGFFDHDGCPDRDDDADGLRDENDACPRSSEDRDGSEDEDGCPEPDDDADAVPDGLDACAMDPEDRDGFEDEDGCPEPGPGVPTVSVGPERMVVSQPILFDYDHDALRESSGPVLDALAAAIRDLPPGVRVLIEVYVDASGNAVYDLDLTSRRAATLAAALGERGVPADRIEHVGRGAASAYAKGRAPDVRARDRRVEILLRR